MMNGANFPETVEPSAPLSEELDALYDFLAHQKSVRATGDRDWIELSRLSEKELEVKIRELENWNFRLNLDEARERKQSNALGIAADASSQQQQS